MKILEKIKQCCGMKCSSDCSDSHKKECSYTSFVICSLRHLLIVAACLAVLSPLMFYFAAPKVIRHHLMKDPDMIIKSVEEYARKKQEEMQTGSVQKVEPIYQSSINDSSLPFVGNRNGSHAVVVFYDYSCGYCKKMANELKALSKKDSQLKIILKDLPLFGEKSIEAAKSSMYVFEKYSNKFEDFHYKLVSSKEINSSVINSVAKSVGINEDIVKASKGSYENNIRNNYVQAGEIRVDGTPALLINGKLYLGYKSADEVARLL